MAMWQSAELWCLPASVQAIWTRARVGRTDLAGLVQHHDHGSQYVSLAYSERLAAASIQPSVGGAVGSSFDNALAETINGLYKTELIKKQGPWRNVDHVELATLNGSTGSTTAGSTSTAATSRPPKWKPLTTLRPEPSRPLRSQTAKSPDMPVRFTFDSGCCAGPRPRVLATDPAHCLTHPRVAACTDDRSP